MRCDICLNDKNFRTVVAIGHPEEFKAQPRESHTIAVCHECRPTTTVQQLYAKVAEKDEFEKNYIESQNRKFVPKSSKVWRASRRDGMIEFHCEHSIGHWDWPHSCDGCCWGWNYPGRRNANQRLMVKRYHLPFQTRHFTMSRVRKARKR